MFSAAAIFHVNSATFSALLTAQSKIHGKSSHLPHGKESGPWGSKIKHLAAVAERHGCKVLSPDYCNLLDPDARVQLLLSMDLLPHDRLVLVGSSMGMFPPWRHSVLTAVGAQFEQFLNSVLMITTQKVD